MAADVSIYNALIQPQKSFVDYQNAYAAQDDARAQRRLNALQMAAAEQSAQDDQSMRNALGMLKPDATLQDRTAALRSIASPKAWKAADALQNADLERQAKQAGINKDNAATSKENLALAYMQRDRHLQALARVTDLPGAASWIQQGVQLGEFSQDDAGRILQGLQSGQIPLDQWKQSAQQGGMTLQQQAQQQIEQMRLQETGRHNRATEGVSQATLAETRRHNKATEGQAATAVTYQQDGNGNFVALPTRLQPGQTAAGVPVIGPDGKPIGKGSTLNDSQAKAYLFGSRMQEADKILGDLSAKGVDMPSLTKMGAETVPLIGGGLSNLANMVASPDQQSVEQAQRDFVNAVLRRESGAAISPTEFDSAKKQYFPQIGDSAQVKAQKARNRQLAIKGMMSEVPANAGGRPAGGGGGGVIDFGSLK